MVTIVVAYNRDRGFLNQCLASIREQTYKDIELIEVHSPFSVSVNFNSGLKRAKGEFIKWVDEDDWLPVDGIQQLVDGMGEHPWIIANSMQVTTPKYVYKPDLSKVNINDMLINNVVHGGTVLYRTELLREIGGMDETLWTGEEYDMNLKLMSMGKMPGYVDEVVCYCRIHSEQKSFKLRRADPEKRLAALNEIRQRYENTST